ncbi:MAG: 4-hydroxy-3-methylbut-2-enyl diphosphate reductase [Bacteroidales bacterium]|nr:4-hydroxy-3-methylbut-2-enyl diphosphate reductase [Candidatus Equimonas faecalis]
MVIEIDEGSGFCFGVTTAIRKAEEELASHSQLYCLGDIVHNEGECERLRTMGLEMIGHEAFQTLREARVLLRAHGEPPATYEMARSRNIHLIDATCPVVLRLQRRIRSTYEAHPQSQIVIYGKPGHAEVLGLVGQTDGTARVIACLAEADTLDYHRDIYLFSQTTKPLEGFRRLVSHIQQHIQPPARFEYYDTICRQVANRLPNVGHFAQRHDVVIFVCGQKSSNGRVLFNACLKENPRSHMVDTPAAIQPTWFEGAQSVGICGATSTPKWLMEQCKERILSFP